MFVRSLTIKSYKSFLRPTSLTFAPSFNVFIGPNNCGKTNILDVISYASFAEVNPERLHHHRARFSLTLELSVDAQKQFTSSKLITVNCAHYDLSIINEAGGIVSPALHSYITSRVKNLHYKDFSDFKQISADYRLLNAKYPEKFKKLMHLLRHYFPEIVSAERITDVEEHGFEPHAAKRNITIDRLGGGFRRILVMLLYAFHPDYSVVLIDEPEIHLHPGMIKKLLRVLVSEETNQIIATSHSPLMIHPYHLHTVYRVLRDSEGSHVYYMKRDSRLDRTRFVQELNADNVEMFFADKVLLVEGVSDRILMRGLIDRFYKGLLDVKVIQTHGKSNIDVYIDLMNIFHIPYLVMLDRDALGTFSQMTQLRRRSGNKRELLEYLQRHNIIILERGTIEDNYPRKFQVKDTKPLNALLAASNITEADYHGSYMKNLRAVIERL